MTAIDEFELVSRTALQALERSEMVALATVVQVRGSAPRHAGARMSPARWAARRSRNA